MRIRDREGNQVGEVSPPTLDQERARISAAAQRRLGIEATAAAQEAERGSAGQLGRYAVGHGDVEGVD